MGTRGGRAAVGRLAVVAFAVHGVNPAIPALREAPANGEPLEIAGIDVPSAAGPRILSVQRIWSKAPHNAFTDLALFDGNLYSTFREGGDHVSPDGALRVLISPDGQAWRSASRIASAGADLRDPRLTVTPEGRLLLTGAAALSAPRGGVTHESRAWLSSDGMAWTTGKRVADPNVWLWRTTWHDGVSYGIGYSVDPADRFVRLYRSADGVSYEVLVDRLLRGGYPNEHGMEVLSDGTMVVLLRRDGEPGSALLGRSAPPYTRWTWSDLGQRIGGPDLLLLPDGRIVAGVRLHGGMVRAALAWLDPRAGTLTEFLSLPSGGDTGYPGLVWHKERLWVSYHSSHEGKTCVYLAQVEIPPRSSGRGEQGSPGLGEQGSPGGCR